tara:strand:+ start:810 stop:1082 length:273 start_codon:yes stop_codon:yes gene_type:complete
MKIPELIDSLIELSTHEMPEEARKSLDDAIDHMVTSLTDNEMNELFQKGLAKTDLIPIKDETTITPHLREEIKEEEEIFKQVIDGNIALA